MRILTTKKDLAALHQVSEEVDKDSEDIALVGGALVKTFYERQGKLQGLAAPQLGIHLRVFLTRWSLNGKPMLIYNPKVLFKAGHKLSNEGCESEPEGRYNVTRPRLIFVSYRDGKWKVRRRLYGHRKARIFMHEFDHLNGVLLRDKGVRV